MLTTEPRRRGATVDTEHLVGGAVKMVKRKYSVSPASDPAVRREEFLEHAGRIVLRKANGTRIGEQRQARIVRNLRVGLEQMRYHPLSHRCNVGFADHERIMRPMEPCKRVVA